MNDPESGWQATEWALAVLGGVSSLFAIVLGWLGRYHVRRLDRTIERVEELREKYVTREEFIAAIARGDRVAEGRHTENVAWPRRIEDTIKENASEAKTDRHRMSDAVQHVVMQVGILVGRDERPAG